MSPEPEHVLLDLSGYQDRDAALALAAHGCPTEYTALAKKHLACQTDITTGYMLFCSFVSRLRGLHEGVVREIAHNTPHAAFPLTRAWVEAITIGLYLLRKPGYAKQILYGPGDSRPARKSFESMFHAVREDAGQLKLVYRDLSDYSHFGTLGVWSAHSSESEEIGTFTWTDAPRWKSERESQIACAQANELAVFGLHTLDRLGRLLVPRTAQARALPNGPEPA